MFIRYFKGEPNMYVIAYRNGVAARKGIGMALWYMPHDTTIANVPISTQDASFIFNEVTVNFQQIAVQGQLSYRFEDPESTARYLDFTIDVSTGRYRSEDPEKLGQRIINAVQAATRSCVNRMELEDVLRDVKVISSRVLTAIREEADLATLGIVIENFHIGAISPTPEMQKALEADYRESLQKRADQAIYDRRAAAQAEEENLRQKELDSEVELEERRKDLVDTQARNSLTLAEAEAKAEEMKLTPYSEMRPQALLALAVKDWALNAGEIGTLNINPDLLGQLVKWVGREHGETGDAQAVN